MRRSEPACTAHLTSLQAVRCNSPVAITRAVICWFMTSLLDLPRGQARQVVEATVYASSVTVQWPAISHTASVSFYHSQFTSHSDFQQISRYVILHSSYRLASTGPVAFPCVKYTHTHTHTHTCPVHSIAADKSKSV